jgi:hypothetical protein
VSRRARPPVRGSGYLMHFLQGLPPSFLASDSFMRSVFLPS